MKLEAEHLRKLSRAIFGAQGVNERDGGAVGDGGQRVRRLPLPHRVQLPDRVPEEAGPPAAITRIKQHAVRHRVRSLFGMGGKA